MKETRDQRSRTMRAVKSRDTRPEMVVRRTLHQAGYRYRLHLPELAGKPDIVFSRKRKVIFVHGCFWHGHRCKRGNRLPATNVGYWKKKIARNVERYGEQVKALKESGWSVLTVWECELGRKELLANRLKEFLEDQSEAA